MDVIDPTSDKSDIFTSEQQLKRNLLARDLIINRLNRHYYNKVSQIQNCTEIMNKLLEARKIEMNVTEVNVRTELYTIKKGVNEKVEVFNDRFDSIIQKYVTCEFGTPLSEVGIRSAYYSAVIGSSPELRSVSMYQQQRDKTQLTLEE